MVLLAKNIGKKYIIGGNKERIFWAVKDLSIQIGHYGFYAITGDSGSGKTTLLKLLGGIEDADTGEIWIEDINICKLTDSKRIEFRRDNVGFVFQDYNLIDFLSVQENIVIQNSLRKKEVEEKQFSEVVKLLGINDSLGKYPLMLSGGEKQRVAIARAIIANPKIILADEPTGSLDSSNTENVFEIFNKLVQRYKLTVIMVTHNEELAKKCDKIFKMKDGMLYDYL